jgi:glucose/arabinose dehydrogenase
VALRAVLILATASIALAGAAVASAPMPARTAETFAARAPYVLRPVVRRLNEPVFVTAPAAEKGRIYIVERAGRVLLFSSGKLQARPFLDIRDVVETDGERGLLSIAFPPDYPRSRIVYAFFSHDQGMEIHSYRVVDGRANRGSDRLLLRVPHPDSPYHDGGQMAFGPDGLLYAGIGDGGYTEEPRPLTPDPHGNAQNLDVLLGKIFRLDVAAASPSPTIVAYGLRNPWRFSFDPRGNLIIGDVGWKSA